MAKQKSMIQDLTQGNIGRQLLRFTLPFLAANMLQLVYGLVDMVFVGQANGSVGLTAVSVGSQITTFFTQVGAGLTTGAQVCISHLVGSNRRDRIEAAIGTAFTYFSIISLMTMAIGLIFCRPVLALVNTPEESMEQAVAYLAICSAGMFFIFGYNTLCAVMRGMGDSDHPLIFVVIASVVNIILDYVLVIVVPLGAAGAAIATVVGQAVSFGCAFRFLYKHREEMHFPAHLRAFRPDKEMLVIINKLGIPLAFQNIAVSFSMVYMNAWINKLGLVAASAAGIGSKLSSIVAMFTSAFSASCAAMTGQNMGAGRVDRVPRIIYTAWAACIAAAVLMSAIFQLFPKAIFRCFTADEAVLELAPSFMPVMMVLLFAFALMSPPIGLVNGVGNTSFNMIVGILDGVVGRIGFSLLLGYYMNLGLNGYYLGNGLAGFISVICCSAYFFFGKWRDRVVVTERKGEDSNA